MPALGQPPCETATDRAAVERDSCAANLTLRVLEAIHFVGYASISRRARSGKWTRDPGARFFMQPPRP